MHIYFNFQKSLLSICSLQKLWLLPNVDYTVPSLLFLSLLPAFKVIYEAWKNRRQHYSYLKAFYKLFKIFTHLCFEYKVILKKKFFFPLFYFQKCHI